MQEDLSNNRKLYKKSALREHNLTDNPMELFRDWYLEAESNEGVEEANAMTLATKGVDGYPKGSYNY